MRAHVTANWVRGVRGSIAVVLAAAAMAIVVLTTPTAVGATTVTGSPQPGLVPFKVGPSTGGGGSVAILPNGNILLAYQVAGSADNNVVAVCVLRRGATACSSRTTLNPAAGATLDGRPQIFATGGNDVSVVENTYGDNPADNGDFLFNSTDGGVHFGRSVLVGTVSVNRGTLADGQLVWASEEQGSGVAVQSAPPNATTQNTASAVFTTDVGDITGLSTYHNGVLVAADNSLASGVHSPTTFVYFAPAGSDFSSRSSYQLVGQFAGNSTLYLNGGALLTGTANSLTDPKPVLRLFNGTGFGAAHAVPLVANPDVGQFSDFQAGGRVRVFYNSARNGYDVVTVSTANGTTWNPTQILGSFLNASESVPGLDSKSTGVVLGTGAGAWVQPILDPQAVQVSLNKTVIAPGQSAVLKGTVAPVVGGRVVQLQRKTGAVWTSTQQLVEPASGRFQFSIHNAGTFRVQVSNKPGYFEFGYSNQVALTVF